MQLDKQKKVYDEQLVLEIAKITKLEELLELITKCQNKMNDVNEVGLDYLLEIFRTLQNKFMREWHLYNLDSLAFHLVFPKLESIMSSWQALEQPLLTVPTITAWKTILDLNDIATKLLQKQQKLRLEDQSNSVISPLSGMDNEDDEEVRSALFAAKDQNRVNVYTQLFYSVVFPKLRHCLMHEWNPRDHVRGTKLVQTWGPYLPPLLYNLLLENVVIARLNQEVNKWNPLADRQLISDWIHPWFPILGPLLDILTERILDKLSPVLIHWRPKDPSAFVLLSPWKKVLSNPAIFEKFLIKTILPKLEIAMNEWTVNPSDQDLTVWNAVINWSAVFSTESFIPFLLRTFFQKWFKALVSWLQSNPNFEEVYRWYTHWKECFPKSYQEEPAILQQFRNALELANSIMDDPTHPISPPQIQMPQLMRESQPKRNPIPVPPRKVPTPVDDMQISLKSAVEKYAEDHNILFMPTKKTWDGKPVYTFGTVSVVIDKDSLYYCKKGKWELTGIEELMKQLKKNK
jgi:tuftelin-interacting protein 11